MAEDKNTSQVNMKIPGMKGGPRNRGAAVEKPVNGKETFMRLMQYFAKEIPVIIALFIAVVVGAVICGTLQHNFLCGKLTIAHIIKAKSSVIMSLAVSLCRGVVRLVPVIQTYFDQGLCITDDGFKIVGE